MSWRRLVCKSARSSVTEVGNDSPHASLVECSVCSPDMSSPSVICDIADSVGTRGFQVCTFSRHYIDSNKIIVAMLPEEFSRMVDSQGLDGEGLDYKDSVIESLMTRRYRCLQYHIHWLAISPFAWNLEWIDLRCWRKCVCQPCVDYCWEVITVSPEVCKLTVGLRRRISFSDKVDWMCIPSILPAKQTRLSSRTQASSFREKNKRPVSDSESAVRC